MSRAFTFVVKDTGVIEASSAETLIINSPGITGVPERGISIVPLLEARVVVILLTDRPIAASPDNTGVNVTVSPLYPYVYGILIHVPSALTPDSNDGDIVAVPKVRGCPSS